MSDMVERVAAAIRNAAEEFDDPVGMYITGEYQRRWEKENPDGDWYEQPESQDDLIDYKIIARAAIEAMREPTEDMKHCDEEVHWGYSCHQCGGLTEGWYKMIDAALTGTKARSRA